MAILFVETESDSNDTILSKRNFVQVRVNYHCYRLTNGPYFSNTATFGCCGLKRIALCVSVLCGNIECVKEDKRCDDDVIGQHAYRIPDEQTETNRCSGSVRLCRTSLSSGGRVKQNRDDVAL